MSYKGKVFILNKPFEGSYTDEEGNVAHEIIDYFKADNKKVYIYNNPWGHCPANIDVDKSKEYSIEYMLLAKRATMNSKDEEKSSRFELTHLIKIGKCLHHESTSKKDEEKLKKAQQRIKNTIREEGISYGGKFIDEIYGNEDKSLFVTFEVEKFYEALKPIPVMTPGYRFQRNKGYVFSDVQKEAFEAIYKKTDLKLWREITDKIPTINSSKQVVSKTNTFLDLIMKVDSEECYTNMLYRILEYKNCINKFIEKFGKISICNNENFVVKRELPIAGSKEIKGGRTDVCAYSVNQSVVIENKVFSGLNGVSFDENNDVIRTQLSVYYDWAKQRKNNPLCFISCPNYRIEEIDTEIEPSMKNKYVFIGYKEISEFIEELNNLNFFSEFAFKEYLGDIVNAFKRFNYSKKSELFESLFLDAINS